jgi:DNA-binding transcriptional MerR regulator
VHDSLYEAQGLTPGVTRDPGGRRVYLTRHVGWLLFLDRLRYAGMTVREMRRYASLAAQGKKAIRQRLALLDAHHARTVAHSAELQGAQTGLLLEVADGGLAAWGLRDGRAPRPSTRSRTAAP